MKLSEGSWCCERSMFPAPGQEDSSWLWLSIQRHSPTIFTIQKRRPQLGTTLLGMVNTMVNTLRSMVLEYLQSQHLSEHQKSPSFVGKYTTHGASGLGYFYMSFSTNKNEQKTFPFKHILGFPLFANGLMHFWRKLQCTKIKKKTMGRNENEPSCTLW